MAAVLAGLVAVWSLVLNGDPGTVAAPPSSTATTTPRTTRTGTASPNSTAPPRSTTPDTADTASPTSTAPPTSSTNRATTTSTAPPTSSTNRATTTSTAPPTTRTTGTATASATIEANSVGRYLDEYHQAVVDDPAAAYEQAGPTLRGSISLAGFEDFWARFEDVAISDVRVAKGGDTALAVMELRYPDGTRQVEQHRFAFIDKDGRLVLDRDSFLKVIKSRS